MTALAKPRFFAPEVVQTSAMDCGPAALKCLLEGFRIPVSYGRLREACQTDVDGTSIDVMEEVANQLGLHAEQTMLPLDHLFFHGARPFPAILIVRNPDGYTHFVVPWSRHGKRVQVMDPATGRRWMSCEDLLAITHVHTMPVPAEAWREWAGSEDFLQGLRARLEGLGVRRAVEDLVLAACEDPECGSLAALDAATRMVSALVRAKGVDPGASAARLLRVSYEQARNELASGSTETSIPPPYWSARPLPRVEDEPQVLLRGAVVVKVERPDAKDAGAPPEVAPPLSPELAAALTEAPARPLRDLAGLLRKDGLLTPLLVTGAVLIATLAGGLEALVLRGSLEAGRHLATWEQRLLGLGALALFLCLLLGIEVPLVASTLTMGRKLELRLRIAFFSKIPRLGDRYFHSRPTSDMTHRAHAIHAVRSLPTLGFRLLRSVADLGVTAAGLIWLDPPSAPFVLGAALFAVGLPWVTQSTLIERDLRVRAYGGSLSRFYLDALLGMMPLRTHAADRALRREHEAMMGEFRSSVQALLGASVTIEALDGILGVVIALGLLFQYLGSGRTPAAALLLVYWALNVPVVGHEIAQAMRQYPAIRNLTLRLLEPLGALEDAEGGSSANPPTEAATTRASRIRMTDVTVRAAGKTLLEQIDVDVASGSHVAIVGPSGAGKSSLMGLLLGWHRAAVGQVLVDGVPLRGEHLQRLRKQTAWVDPTVQLWNRSMLENLQYGNPHSTEALASVLDAAGVVEILQRLQEGLAGSLGEGGALVSGGEGQRVRLARAMLRSDSRLVILDEPFRGLDRDRRRALLDRARTIWKDATLFCVTHDVGDTLGFPRVLVIDQGRIVEDGPPQELAQSEGSRYRALLDAEHMVHHGLWSDASWRRLRMSDGRLTEGGG